MDLMLIVTSKPGSNLVPSSVLPCNLPSRRLAYVLIFPLSTSSSSLMSYVRNASDNTFPRLIASEGQCDIVPTSYRSVQPNKHKYCFEDGSYRIHVAHCTSTAISDSMGPITVGMQQYKTHDQNFTIVSPQNQEQRSQVFQICRGPN